MDGAAVGLVAMARAGGTEIPRSDGFGWSRRAEEPWAISAVGMTRWHRLNHWHFTLTAADVGVASSAYELRVPGS